MGKDLHDYLEKRNIHGAEFVIILATKSGPMRVQYLTSGSIYGLVQILRRLLENIVGKFGSQN